MERTAVQDQDKGVQAEEFDPIIVGPWMDLWDIEEHQSGKDNKHTARYLGTPAEARDPDNYIKAGNW